MDQKAVIPEVSASLEERPGVLIVGAPNVGKRTLLSRLLSIDLEDTADTSSSGLHAFGWSIKTKYYTADVCVWLADLHEKFSVGTLPIVDQLAALVMVFDISNVSSFHKLKEWASHTDLHKFDILLCIGNKVDLLPGHSAHTEYRRKLLKHADSWGFDEAEGISLLGNDENEEIKQDCMKWCVEHNIEYVEACASNVDFDSCLSMDGDSQGIDRLQGALSAYMWPGMVLKSGDIIHEPSLPQSCNYRSDLSEEESDYEHEYEILSAGSSDPWDIADEDWVSAGEGIGERNLAGESESPLESESAEEAEIPGRNEMGKGTAYKFEDLEVLMGEIGNVRDNLRLMPDFQRREMAATLALKMAAMFGDDSGDEELD